MTIIQVVVVLIIVGILLWLVNGFLPMDPTIKKLLNAVVIITVVIWLLLFLLRAFDLAGPIGAG